MEDCTFRVGDTVKIFTDDVWFKMEGKVIAVFDHDVDVMVGKDCVTFNFDELELIGREI